MDNAATELLTASRRSLVKRRRPGAGASGAEGFSAVLLVALSLAVAGCQSSRPATSGGAAAPPPQVTIRSVEQPPSATKPPDAPVKIPQPVRAPAPRVTEAKPATKLPTKPPPATASKGAERLLALTSPLTVRARERTTLPAQPSTPKASTAESAGTVTGAPAAELVFHGSASQARPPQRSVTKALWWLGLLVGGAVLALLARLRLIRRSEILQLRVGDDALRMPRELGFKEPVGAQEP